MAQINKHSNGMSSFDTTTFNPRFPGLDEANYNKLKSKIDSLGYTGSDWGNAMDEAYRQILPLVQNQMAMNERDNYINQSKWEASQITEPEAQFEANGKMTTVELAQLIKKKYNVDPKADDKEVFNSWLKTVDNGPELLANYMNSGDRTLLYEGGLATRQVVPESQYPTTAGGRTALINKQSEVDNDTRLGKADNTLDRVNLVGKGTEWVDSWVQKIPTLTYEGQVQNLANKMNNLTEDEVNSLYEDYVKMVKNGTDQKWQKDGRGPMELLWDALMGDKDALDRLNAAHLYNYKEAMPQDGIERNKWGNQLTEWAGGQDWDTAYQNSIDEINNSGLPGIITGPAKATAWTADKAVNLLNFIGGAWGSLENYAEATAVGIQELKDISNNNFYPTINGQLESDRDVFMEYVADRVANFGEYMTDAPDTLMGRPISPNAVKFFTNLPQSFIKTLSGKIRAKTNPLDTKVGLLKLIFTDEGQQALWNRYGTPEALANAMNTDPYGVCDDLIDMADKFNAVVSGVSGGYVPRTNIGDITDTMSDNIVKGNINLKNDTVIQGALDKTVNKLPKVDIKLSQMNANLPGIVNSLNNFSNFLDKKGRKSLGSFVDFENRISQTDPGQLFTDPNKFANDFGQTMRAGVDIFGNAKGDVQDWLLNKANRKLQNINRMSKGKQEKFHDMTGQDVGGFMNKRGYKTLDEVEAGLVKNLDQVDKAMETIQGRYKSKALDVVVDEVLKYAIDTEDENISRLQELANKNKEGGLEMKEINEIKRYYERTNIFDYLKEGKSKKSRKATNRDTALRKWQQEIAEQAGLDNLKELNKETQALYYILDEASGWQNGIKGNNEIKLTDWIIAAGGGLSTKSIASMVGKEIYESSWFQRGLVDVMNYLGGREHEAGPTVDFDKINQANQERAKLEEYKNNRLEQRNAVRENQRQTQARLTNIERAILAAELTKVKNEEDFKNWLKKAELTTQALPYNPAYNGEPTTTIKVTPDGTSITNGQIAELPGKNSKNDVYTSNEMNNIESDLDSNQKTMDERNTKILELADELKTIDQNDKAALDDWTRRMAEVAGPVKQGDRELSWDQEEVGNMPIEEDEYTDENALDYRGNRIDEQEYETREEMEEAGDLYEYDDYLRAKNDKFTDKTNKATAQAEDEWNMDREKSTEEGEEIWVDNTDSSNVQTEAEHKRWVKERANDIIENEWGGNLSKKRATEMAEEEWNNDWSKERGEDIEVWRDRTDSSNTQTEEEHKNWVKNRAKNIYNDNEIKSQLDGAGGRTVDEYKKDYIYDKYSDEELEADIGRAQRRYDDYVDKYYKNGKWTDIDNEGYSKARYEAAQAQRQIQAAQELLDERANSPIGKPIKGDFENMTEEEKVRAYYEAIGEEMPEEKSFDQEKPITESGKRPWKARPEAGNDVEFALTDELQRAHRPSDIEYINQDGEWLQGDSEENTIRIAYPDTFESYDTDSLSDRQNGMMDILSDSGMMKVSYDDGYVNIDLMYEPTEDQIDSLRSIGENDEIKHVQINILDPQAKHTVRINDLNSMAETIDYINEYFGDNGSNLDNTANKTIAERIREQGGEYLDWLDKVSDEKFKEIDSVIRDTLSEEDVKAWDKRVKNFATKEGRGVWGALSAMYGYSKAGQILREAGYRGYSSDDKLYTFEEGRTLKYNQPNDYDRAKKATETKINEDKAYRPSITMSEKEINSKYAGKTQIEMKNELENQMRKMEFGDRIMITDVSQGNKRTLIIEKGQRDGTDRWNLMDANGRMVDDSKYLGNITFNLRVEDLGEIYSNSEAKEKYQKEYDKARKDIEKERIEKQKQREREEKAKIKAEKEKLKEAKNDINDMLSNVWHDIGDEGDWDWYKKMKKKDVITYVEDQVLDEFSDARKRGYDYGLEWSEVQKLIKKFVNDRMKNVSNTKQSNREYDPYVYRRYDEGETRMDRHLAGFN